MTLLGVFGIILGLTAARWAFVSPTRVRVVVFLLAYLAHLGTTLLYYSLVSGFGGDASMYYNDPIGYFDEGFGLSTHFIVYITQSLKLVFGGTMLDYFLLYQAVGFFGVAILMRTFEEIFGAVDAKQPAYIYLLLFLPGLNYWSSAIGKDALQFFSTSLCVWAAINLRQRIPFLIGALLLMICVRPHIAVITLVAVALTVFAEKGTKLSVRVLLFLGALAGTGFAAATVWSTFQIDLTNADSVSDHLSNREALIQTGAGGVTVVDVIYPLRVLSLLFRPFFFDANGALGLVVSFENVVIVLIIGVLLRRRKMSQALFKAVPFARFALLSSVAVLLTLSLGYYNVGLGIRQKATMILPGLLVFFAAVRAAQAVGNRQSTMFVSSAAQAAV